MSDFEARLCPDCFLNKKHRMAEERIKLSEAINRKLIRSALSSIIQTSQDLANRGLNTIAFISDRVKALSAEIHQRTCALKTLQESADLEQDLSKQISEIAFLRLTTIQEQSIRQPLGLYFSFESGVETMVNAWNAEMRTYFTEADVKTQDLIRTVAQNTQSLLQITEESRCQEPSVPDGETTMTGHSDCVCSVAFSSDGKFIASGSGDKTIKVWNLQKKREEFTLQGHLHWVYSVAFSSDGKFIVSGSHDETIKVWNLKQKREEFVLRGHSDSVLSLNFSSDGKFIVSGSWDKTIKICFVFMILLKYTTSMKPKYFLKITLQ